jgi:hypothetical protein
MIDKLVVMKPFQSFVRGDIITDPTRIREIMDSDHLNSVRPVLTPAHGRT